MKQKLPPGQSLINVPIMVGKVSATADREEREQGEWIAWSTASGWPGEDHVHGKSATEAVRAALLLLSQRVSIVEAPVQPPTRVKQ